MDNIPLNDYRKIMERKRRARDLALAILQRAKSAGIPEALLRIGEDECKSLICRDFHKNADDFVHEIFNNPKMLFQKPFIIIDGGNIESRKRMGYAILFRMIACNSMCDRAKCESFKTISHTMGNFKDVYETNRNEYVLELASYSVLMLSELDKKDINVHIEAGSYLDEMFEIRSNRMNPTILTYTHAIPSTMNPIVGSDESKNLIEVDDYGQHMLMFSRCDIEKNTSIIRIRVK